MRLLRRLGLATLVFAAAVMAPSFARAAGLDADLAEYGEVVTRYRSADESAVETIVSWPRSRLLATTTRLWQLKDRGRQRQPWDTAQVSAAALLHLDVLARGSAGDVGLHLWILRKHLAGLRGHAPGASLTADLHLGLALLLQGELRLADLQEVFDDAAEVFESRGDLLLARGTFHEVLASRRLESARRAALVPTANWSLARAERSLRRAVLVAPALVEARLRLAHVRLQQGHGDEAVTLLEGVRRESGDADQRYLAGLFLGQAHGAAGRTGEAEAAYAAAGAERPCGQAATFGLAHLAYRDGRFDAAREILQRRAQPPTGCPDPWAVYDYGQARRLPGLIAAMKDAVRR